jgi:hypothetical protein
MTALRPQLCALLGTACLTAGAFADSPESPVRHDPFSRPAVERLLDTPGEAVLDGRVAHAKLKGVLITGELHLANIDGRILARGDDIYGYRVLAISERNVTLRRGHDVLTMELNGVELAHGDRD